MVRFADIRGIREQLDRIEKQNVELLALMSPKATRKFIPVDDAAARLGRSSWTVRQLCVAGEIRAVKAEDGRWRIPVEEVARLEDEGVPKLPKR